VNALLPADVIEPFPCVVAAGSEAASGWKPPAGPDYFNVSSESLISLSVFCRFDKNIGVPTTCLIIVVMRDKPSRQKKGAPFARGAFSVSIGLPIIRPDQQP
jgi:hypothetical protein